MAKRDGMAIGKHKSKTHKTKKRLAAKKIMLEVRKAKKGE